MRSLSVCLFAIWAIGGCNPTKAGADESPAPSEYVLETIRIMGDGREVGYACPTYSGLDQIVERAKSSVIMIGEFPGTDQAAEATTSLVCETLRKGLPVRLGLQVPDGYIFTANEMKRLALRDQ